MKIIKRNGKEVENDPEKIANAIRGANGDVKKTMMDPKYHVTEDDIARLTNEVEMQMESFGRAVSVEEIQDMVEMALMADGKYCVAKAYVTYRYEHAMRRNLSELDQKILSLVACENEEVKQENSNKDTTIIPVQRDYMAGEISRSLCKRHFLPEDIVRAHEEGIIHFHDMDYFAQSMHNCCLINLDDMLQNGTVISGKMIDPPKSFATACTITTQIISQVACSQYGGQTFSLAQIAKFVDVSRKKIAEKMRMEFEKFGICIPDEEFVDLVEDQVREEVKNGIQTIQYQLVTFMTTNGQAPFVSMYMCISEAEDEQTKADLILCMEEVFRQRIQGIKNEKGVWITPEFPKLLYVLEEDNIREDSKYWELTKLAAKCTAKRMVPDLISAKVMKEQKGDVYGCMGCRSFLTPDRFTDAGLGNMARAKNFDGKHKYYGRFNQGVVTINLVDAACSSEKNENKFWEIFEERLELCHKALRLRHERLLGTSSDVAPILWQYGGLARLNKGEKIDRLLYDGYSTISLGYAGLYECTKYMTGESHTGGGKEFAIRVMKKMNDKCAEWKQAENIDYSLYGTPLESTTYKFAKCLQRRFGKIPEVTEHNYITNSYHVSVREEINAFQKLQFESEFQALSPGGAISYVEVPNLTQNLEAVLLLYQFIYDNIMYAELNTKSDYCQACGFDGEIVIEEEKSGKLIWKCPNCGNTDQHKMNVARRTCGYIGSQFWNQGRTQEIRDRVLHL